MEVGYTPMKLKLFVIAVLSLLVATNVSALEINPPILNLDGENGDFSLQTVELYNDRNTSVTVNITITGIDNYYLPKNTYTLHPYERKTITIGFTITGSKTGFITYDYGYDIATQVISINSKKSLVVFPQNPIAGNSIAIICSSNDKASGFLFVSETGKQYPVLLSGLPLTFVNTSKDDFGNAILVLIWDDGQITYNYLNITKAKNVPGGEDDNTTEDELTIDFGGSKNIDYGKSRIITMKLNDEPVEGTFIITKPGGDQILKDANSMGKIQITFDEAGTWSFSANYKNLTENEDVSVSKNNIQVSIPDETIVGETFSINVGNDGNYTILTPSLNKVNGQTVNGIINYEADEGGLYTISIETSSGHATGFFKAYYEPIISITDETGAYVNYLKKGKPYQITVVAKHTDEIIYDVDEIDYIHNGIHSTIQLTNGIGNFVPEYNGYYTLSIPKDDAKFIKPVSFQLMVFSDKVGSSIPWKTIIIVGIIVGAIILIFASRRTKNTVNDAGVTGKTKVTEGKGFTFRIINWLFHRGPPFWK